MTDKNKLYRTPSGEIVTGAELVEVPRTAEEVIRAAVETINGWYVKQTNEQVTQHIFTALREADMLKEPDDGWIKHDGGPCPVDGDVQVAKMSRGSGMGWCYQARKTTYDCEVVYELVEAYPDLMEEGDNIIPHTVNAVTISADSKEELAKWLRQAADDVEKYEVIEND